MKKIIQAIIPFWLGAKLRGAWQKFLGWFYKGNNYYCPLCQHSFRKMLPAGIKNEIFEKFNVDDVIKGTVSRIVEYGAFVDLGDGVEGLIHRNDLSWSVISNPREVVQPGETVEAKDGMVIIDGKYALKESDYVGDAVFDMAAVTVPDGCVFVLSDDRNYGEDSRNAAIGCIDTNAILGVVKIRLNRFTVFVRG